jgi:hypothetical protein
VNLFALLQRGAAHAPSETQRRQAQITASAEAARAMWLNALFVDQTRAWMSIGEYDAGVLSGMASILTMAGMAHVHDTKSTDSVDLRVIRGAISAATQCAKSGGIVSVDDARAFSSAAVRAQNILREASVPAILHAAVSIRQVVGLVE